MASGNSLAGGNISLKLFMAPLEAIEPLTFDTSSRISLCAIIGGFQLLV